MTAPFSVRIADEATRASLAPALAALPKTLRETTALEADIHIIDGRDENWPALVALARDYGARGVLVHRPVPLTAAAGGLADVAAAIPVVIDLPWSGNPAVRALTPSSISGTVRLVVAGGVVEPGAAQALESGAIDAIIAITGLTGGVKSFEAVQVMRSASSISVAGRVGELPVRVSVTASIGGRTAELGWHADDFTLMAYVPDPATAAPAEIVRTDAAGSLLHPTVYESTTRTTLRRLASALHDGTLPSDAPAFRAASTALVPALLQGV